MKINSENVFNRKNVIMLNTGIGMQKTGLVISMLKRANILASQGHHVTIFTVHYNVELDLVYQDMLKNGMLSSNVKFVNMYDFYQRRDITATNQSIERYSSPGCDDTDVTYNGNSILFKDGALMKRYEILRPDGKLSYINFFSDGKIKFRAKYDALQRLSSMQKLNQDGTYESISFFDTDGRLKLLNEYCLVDKSVVIKNIILFNKEGFIEGMFKSEKELFIHTMNHLYGAQDTIYYIIIDNCLYFTKILCENKHNNYRYIGTIHASHFSNYLDRMSQVNNNYVEYFSSNSKEKLDSIVFLTKKQKEHADERFDCSDISTVIPHVYDKAIDNGSTERKPFSCIALGRFDVVKRFPEMIKIFSFIVKKCPEATLSIYGYGTEENKIKESIDNFCLDDKVKLYDYTENVDEIYQSADLMLFTSRSEGFGLVIMESLANGCPVVSYDINYGPSEMIINGKNGYLIPNDRDDLFAQKVSTLLKNRIKLKQMQERCKTMAKKYNANDFAARWNNLFDSVN